MVTMLRSRIPELGARISEAKPTGNRYSGRSNAGRLRGRTLQRRNDRIKLRDKHTCAACGRISTDHDVDHRIPLFQGGTEADDNCQLLCTGEGRCHDQKSRTERGQKPAKGCDVDGYPVSGWKR